MRRISIVFVLVTLIATISVATTMTMVQADPTGDEIKIIIAGIPASPQEVTSIVSPDSPEYVGFVLGIPLFVEVENDLIWVDLPFGLPDEMPFSVHIEDLDWLDESGNEIPGRIADVRCELFIEGLPVGISPVDWGDDVIWIFVEFLGLPLGIPVSVHCEYFVEHEEPEPASIHVLKFNDRNANEVQDPGEDGIAGWTIWLDCIVTNTGEPITRHAETGDNGMVWFENIPAPAECIVTEEERDGWIPITPPAVPVQLDPGIEETVNFGNQQIPASIHVLKFNDRNGNGAQELPDEEGIAGWTIWIECRVINTGEVISLHAETDDNGMVWFENIPAPAECIVTEEERDGWIPITPPEVLVQLDPGIEETVNFGNQLRVIQVEQVEIDIKPGSDPSSVNCKNLKGNVPVAIFGSDNFDVIDIEIVSMNLVGLDPIQVFEVHDELHIDDLNDDGFDDAVLHLDKAEVCEATEDAPLKETVVVELTGQTTDGTEFAGTGDIRIVKR